MPAVRLAAVVLALLAVAPATHAAVPAPKNLKPFLLRADEAPARTFARTPSFAWSPVRGARRYEFELATRSSFPEGSVVWSGTSRIPTVAIPISLPWMTGTPYALWARVRAVTAGGGFSNWTAPYGFNTRWANTPEAQTSTPGLVRWSPVEGATGYNVWFLAPNKVVATKTNVADEREHWTFHQDPAFTSAVRWRVRAVRTRIGTSVNGIPAVSYGPWSPVYVDFNPPVTASPLALSTMAADAFSHEPTAFKLMPALTFGGTMSGDGAARELYRVYITTDSDCVNVVYRGSIVGSPAWAPRVTGPLVLPGNALELARARAGYIVSDGKQGKTFAIDNSAANENESRTAAAGGTGGTGGQSGGTGGGSGGSGGTGGGEDLEKVEAAALSPPLVDLWDNGWPENRYYWTVVGVQMRGSLGDATSIEYQDVELPQDACAAGRVSTFGKVSEAVVTTSGAPYVSGLSPAGRLFSASRRTPAVYGSPLVAWRPALGADRYEVQWSRRAYPWTKVGGLETPATSALLPLAPGRWYYRVRGISLALPEGGRQMTWSDPVAIRVSGPRFRIVRR
jgi:hypothetical protein